MHSISVEPYALREFILYQSHTCPTQAAPKETMLLRKIPKYEEILSLDACHLTQFLSWRNSIFKFVKVYFWK